MKYVSALVTAAAGKVRGLVASHNKGGTYFRGRTIPVNPNTPAQANARNRVSLLISRFRAVLASSSRASWNVFAANTSVIDSLGNSMLLTGPNWYVKSNSIRQQGGLSTIDNASTIFALSTLSPVSGTVTAGGTAVTIGFAGGDDWNGNSVTAGLNIYASRPQNGTVNYFKGPFQFAGRISSTSAVAATASLALPFASGTSGQRQFFRGVATSADGRPSSEFRFFSASP